MPILQKFFQYMEVEEIFYNPFLDTNIMYLYLVMISSRGIKRKTLTNISPWRYKKFYQNISK